MAQVLVPAWVILNLDMIISIIGLFIAYLLRFNFSIPTAMVETLSLSIIVYLIVRFGFFILLGTYRMYVRFTSVKDLAYMISCAVLQDEINGIINCCSGSPVSLAAQMEQFIKDNELSISLEYGAFPDRPYDSPGVWGNADKIKAIMASRNC